MKKVSVLIAMMVTLAWCAPAAAESPARWELAGTWRLVNVGPTAVHVRVQGDGTLVARFEAPGKRASAWSGTIEITKAGRVIMVARPRRKSSKPGWRLNARFNPDKGMVVGLVKFTDGTRRRMTVERKKLPKLSPQKAVELAIRHWMSTHTKRPDMARVSISQHKGEWWVKVPVATGKGRRSRPTHLTVAIALAGGPARGPFGR